MKSFLIIALAALSFNVFAGPATFQKCVGTDSVSKERARFTVQFSEHVMDYGYATQIVRVTKIGEEKLNDEYHLNQDGFPTCRKNPYKRLSYLSNGQTRFTARCDGNVLYSITATCELVY